MWHNLDNVASNRFLDAGNLKKFAADNADEFGVDEHGRVSQWNMDEFIEAYRAAGNTERLVPVQLEGSKVKRRANKANPTKTMVVLYDLEDPFNEDESRRFKKVLDILTFDEVLDDKDDDYFLNLKGEQWADRIVEVLVEFE